MRDAVGSVQSILVLGGTSDIGVAIARRLAAERHADILLAGRDLARLEAVAATLDGAGVVDVVEFDADNTEAHDDFAEKVFAERDVDVVVLAAGVLGEQTADEDDPQRAVAVLRTNFLGCASIALAVGNRLRRQGHGTLVVLSSVAGERVRRSNFVYGASKAGLDGFAQGLGDALAPAGVRVVIVRPGFVRSKMTEGRPAVPFSTTPEAVAEATADAVRRGREVIWVPGILRVVMAVLRHVPRVVFRRLPL